MFERTPVSRPASASELLEQTLSHFTHLSRQTTYPVYQEIEETSKRTSKSKVQLLNCPFRFVILLIGSFLIILGQFTESRDNLHKSTTLCVRVLICSLNRDVFPSHVFVRRSKAIARLRTFPSAVSRADISNSEMFINKRTYYIHQIRSWHWKEYRASLQLLRLIA